MIRLLALLIVTAAVTAAAWYAYADHPVLGVVVWAVGALALVLPALLSTLGLLDKPTPTEK